jgi:acyl carrier protein
MENNRFLLILRQYVIDEILEGHDVGLEYSTPLLELGILNSIEITRLLRFMDDTFGVSIPPEKITPQNFHDLNRIHATVVSLNQSGPFIS